MLEQVYNAIFIGSIYALFAVGFALVFSVLDILNLAYPTVFMLGAFVALFAIATLGLPWYVAIVLAFVATGLFGILLDRIAFAPLRRRGAPQLSTMISSIAVTLVVVRLVGSRRPGGSAPRVRLRLARLEDGPLARAPRVHGHGRGRHGQPPGRGDRRVRARVR